jgi:hypothetical protein
MTTIPTFNELLERLLSDCTEYVSGALRTFIDTLSVVAPKSPLYTLNVKNAQVIENGETHDGYVIVVTDVPVGDPNNAQEVLDNAIMKRFIAIDETGRAIAFIKYDEPTSPFYSGVIN